MCDTEDGVGEEIVDEVIPPPETAELSGDLGNTKYAEELDATAEVAEPAVDEVPTESNSDNAQEVTSNAGKTWTEVWVQSHDC